jgi:hypothetical protein
MSADEQRRKPWQPMKVEDLGHVAELVMGPEPPAHGKITAGPGDPGVEPKKPSGQG